MTAWIRSNICKEPTIRRLLPSLVKITWPTMLGSSWDWALVSAARRENPGNECKSLVESSADSGGEGKSKRAEKHGTKKSKERREKIIYRLLSMNKIMKGIDRNRQ